MRRRTKNVGRREIIITVKRSKKKKNQGTLLLYLKFR